MSQMTFVSLMACNADPFYRDLCGYLSEETPFKIQFPDHLGWKEQEELLDRGEAHLAVLCGLSYMKKKKQHGSKLEPAVAPVMEIDGYGDRPIYYSNIVIRKDRQAKIQSPVDLQNSVLAYNEPHSHSGYNMLRYFLKKHDLPSEYIEVVRSGSHLKSLRMIVEGTIDAAVIDSIVLARERRRNPELMKQMTSVRQLGPSPVPPLVFTDAAPDSLKDTLRELLVGMHRNASGRACLQNGLVSKFVEVDDRTYDPIRRIDEIVEGRTQSNVPMNHSILAG